MLLGLCEGLFVVLHGKFFQSKTEALLRREHLVAFSAQCVCVGVCLFQRLITSD